MTPRVHAGTIIAMVVLAMTVQAAQPLVLAQDGTATNEGTLVAPRSSPMSTTEMALPLASDTVIPLIRPDLPLRGAPVEVPLELRIPALDIRAPVLGVGLTETNAMAAPIGMREDDPVWQSVFWYRGGGIPGEVGTATFAGHYDTETGLPAVFAFLEDMRTGDLVIVHDQRSGEDIPYIVTETATYTNEEASDPAVLARIFGASAADAPPASDELSRLALITCAGAWVDGTFDLRFVVYAVRASYPAGVGDTEP